VWENLAFGLVLGGALGNAIDRVAFRLGRLGGVRDFIHVDLGFWPLNPFPTFNLADSGITVGFALLVLLSLRTTSDPG
jgi:signal peptidase II